MMNALISYGILIITGDFGSGKTFNCIKLISKSDAWLNIGNVESNYIDIEFSSLSDLVLILNQVKELKENNPDLLHKKINLIVDEAAIYFFARNFQKFPSTLNYFLFQLRKINVSLFLVVQRTVQLDKVMRDLSMGAWYIKKGFLYDKILEGDIRELELLEETHKYEEVEEHRWKKALGYFWTGVFNFFRFLKYNTYQIINPTKSKIPSDFSIIEYIKDREKRLGF